MANKVYAKEWLLFSKKNLDTAKLLYEVNHYEDIIGVELQQSLEKMLKSMLAYHNKTIPKTHKLLEIVANIDNLELDVNEIRLLETATNYYRVDRYPNPNYTLPTRDEIKDLLDFTENLFYEVCTMLQIEAREIN